MLNATPRLQVIYSPVFLHLIPKILNTLEMVTYLEFVRLVCLTNFFGKYEAMFVNKIFHRGEMPEKEENVFMFSRG